jgi:signal transduction histidine kinase
VKLTAFSNRLLLAWLAAAAGASFLIWHPLPQEYSVTGLTFIVLAATALVPFQARHTFALGVTIAAMYFLSYSASDGWRIPAMTADRNSRYIFVAMLTACATAITASNAEHRRREKQAAQEAVRNAQALTGAQLRAQLAETAISIGKLAAALSHEINSPLGVLRSGIQTLWAIEGSPEKFAEMAQTRAELYRGVLKSASRIEDVMLRLRLFVTLEEAELKPADLNELLMGVKWMHENEIAGRQIELKLDFERSLPELVCRPQLLTTVFSSILSNAVNAVNGDGRIGISTRLREREIAVTIQDNGKGMTAEEADTIFEPQFKVNGSRVASGNWSLFNARQIVYEHGGTISVETALGAGTAVHVVLPIAA